MSQHPPARTGASGTPPTYDPWIEDSTPVTIPFDQPPPPYEELGPGQTIYFVLSHKRRSEPPPQPSRLRDLIKKKLLGKMPKAANLGQRGYIEHVKFVGIFINRERAEAHMKSLMHRHFPFRVGTSVRSSDLAEAVSVPIVDHDGVQLHGASSVNLASGFQFRRHDYWQSYWIYASEH